MFYLLILVAAASRFLPHPPNVACVAAIGLFAGCYLAGRRAYLVPLSIMLLSDVIGQALGVPGMGFYQPVTMAMVYAGMLAAVPIGRWLGHRSQGQHKHRLLHVPFGSLAASTVFFLLSNFGVWLAGWYTLSLAGLVACYANALPFFQYTLAGDLIFSMILFGVWEWSRQGQASGQAMASNSLPASSAIRV